MNGTLIGPTGLRERNYTGSYPILTDWLRPQRSSAIHDVQEWGIFNRYNGEFSTGIDVFDPSLE